MIKLARLIQPALVPLTFCLTFPLTAHADEFAIQTVQDASTATAPKKQIVPLSPEANEFIRALILLSVEDRYVDDDDWGGSKRIQSGLNMKLHHGRLETSRRWKTVNHGTWKRAELRLLEPEKNFQLELSLLPPTEAAETRYRVRASARLLVSGRQQNWTNGVKLYSISGEATADVMFFADIRITRQFIERDNTRRLQILPEMETAALHLTEMQITRIGHAKGTLAREFGQSIESIVRRMIRREGEKLASRINEKIKKKPDRFEIPLGFLAFGRSRTSVTAE